MAIFGGHEMLADCCEIIVFTKFIANTYGKIGVRKRTKNVIYAQNDVILAKILIILKIFLRKLDFLVINGSF